MSDNHVVADPETKPTCCRLLYSIINLFSGLSARVPSIINLQQAGCALVQVLFVMHCMCLLPSQAFMMVCMALVQLMTPGLAFFYGGLQLIPGFFRASVPTMDGVACR